jgi:hypothetical protein
VPTAYHAIPDDLGVYGLDFSWFPTHSADRDFDRWVVEYEVARGFLTICSRIVPCGIASGVNSYSLKHMIEAWSDARDDTIYIPNGVAILAALDLDIPWRRQPDSPNIDIGINGTRLARASDRWGRMVRGEATPPYTRYDATDKALDAALGVNHQH